MNLFLLTPTCPTPGFCFLESSNEKQVTFHPSFSS